MTDFFLVLISPGAGDELQGLKKGMIELADMLAINKADGDNIARSRATAAEYSAALHILGPRSPHWAPPVIAYSALTGTGIAEIWERIRDHRQRMQAAGEDVARRRRQQVTWMWSMLEARLFTRLKSDPRLRSMLARIETAVTEGRLSPSLAVEEIAGALGL
jgi:LAO/AO transport system kinase